MSPRSVKSGRTQVALGLKMKNEADTPVEGVPKKRGRPPGSKNIIRRSETTIKEQLLKPDGTKRRRGRPPRIPLPQMVVTVTKSIDKKVVRKNTVLRRKHTEKDLKEEKNSREHCAASFTMTNKLNKLKKKRRRRRRATARVIPVKQKAPSTKGEEFAPNTETVKPLQKKIVKEPFLNPDGTKRRGRPPRTPLPQMVVTVNKSIDQEIERENTVLRKRKRHAGINLKEEEVPVPTRKRKTVLPPPHSSSDSREHRVDSLTNINKIKKLSKIKKKRTAARAIPGKQNGPPTKGGAIVPNEAVEPCQEIKVSSDQETQENWPGTVDTQEERTEEICAPQSSQCKAWRTAPAPENWEQRGDVAESRTSVTHWVVEQPDPLPAQPVYPEGPMLEQNEFREDLLRSLTDFRYQLMRELAAARVEVREGAQIVRDAIAGVSAEIHRLGQLLQPLVTRLSLNNLLRPPQASPPVNSTFCPRQDLPYADPVLRPPQDTPPSDSMGSPQQDTLPDQAMNHHQPVTTPAVSEDQLLLDNSPAQSQSHHQQNTSDAHHQGHPVRNMPLGHSQEYSKTPMPPASKHLIGETLPNVLIAQSVGSVDDHKRDQVPIKPLASPHQCSAPEDSLCIPLKDAASEESLCSPPQDSAPEDSLTKLQQDSAPEGSLHSLQQNPSAGESLGSPPLDLAAKDSVGSPRQDLALGDPLASTQPYIAPKDPEASPQPSITVDNSFSNPQPCMTPEDILTSPQDDSLITCQKDMAPDDFLYPGTLRADTSTCKFQTGTFQDCSLNHDNSHPCVQQMSSTVPPQILVTPPTALAQSHFSFRLSQNTIGLSQSFIEEPNSSPVLL